MRDEEFNVLDSDLVEPEDGKEDVTQDPDSVSDEIVLETDAEDTEFQSETESKSKSKGGNKSTQWIQAVDRLPSIIATSKGPRVRLLQAVLNYCGETYLPLDGKMSPTVKGVARRIKEAAGCRHSENYCDNEVWHFLLGDKTPKISNDKSNLDRATLLLQSLLYIHGYQIHPSGYWNDQTQWCLDKYCHDNDLNNKLTATVWASLLDIS